jgi:hypothetical protein
MASFCRARKSITKTLESVKARARSDLRCSTDVYVAMGERRTTTNTHGAKSTILT